MAICVTYSAGVPAHRDDCVHFFSLYSAKLNESFTRQITFKVPANEIPKKLNFYTVVGPKANLRKEAHKAKSLELIRATAIFSLPIYRALYVPLKPGASNLYMKMIRKIRRETKQRDSKCHFDLFGSNYLRQLEKARKATEDIFDYDFMVETEKKFVRDLVAKGVDVSNIDGIEDMGFTQRELALLLDPETPEGFKRAPHFLRRIKLRTLNDDRSVSPLVMANEVEYNVT